MSRRRRGKSSNSPWLAFTIVAIAIVALYFLISNGIFSGFGGDSSCGSREEDSEKSGYCLTTKNDYDELVIVTGNTQNSPAPDLDFTQGQLYDILGGVFYNTPRGDKPRVQIVSVAGNSYIINYKDKYKPAQNIRASNNELKKLGKELNDVIKSAPSEAGADYVNAILEAKNLFSNSSSHPAILVIGSGYSDSGVLNFASGDIFGKYWANPDSITTILSQNRRTKEGILDGATILWYNLGEVVSPQPNMNTHKEDTKAIYESTLAYLGASKISLSNYTGLTANAKSVTSEYSVQPTFIDELKIGDILNVNENIGQFHGDQAVLKNQSEVENKLVSFAKRFNVNSKTKLKLTGYLAYCVNDGQLALARANTIKNILMKLGIPDNKMETHGERGSPPEKNSKEAYTCNSSLPESERRTVKIEVVQE